MSTTATATPVSLPPALVPGAVPPTAGVPKKKICCACPDTKKVRDECIARNGQDQCGDVIELHKACLRAEGFNI